METPGHQLPPRGLWNDSLEDAVMNKERVHQLYFNGALLQAKVKNRVFVKVNSRYADYFPEYSNYFGIAFIEVYVWFD